MTISSKLQRLISLLHFHIIVCKYCQDIDERTFPQKAYLKEKGASLKRRKTWVGDTKPYTKYVSHEENHVFE